jgi:hypothetical protein
MAPPRTKRNLRFQEQATVILSPSPLLCFDSENDWFTLWYLMEELDKFRNEARDICREMKYHDMLVHYADDNSSSDSESSSQAISSRVTPTLARSSYTRGLEQRSCTERQRRKYLSTRFILKIAPRLYKNDPNKLAEVAQKCNAWATELAIEEAARDCIRVHDDGWSSTTITKTSRSGSNKRYSFESTEKAQKRLRI